MCHAGGWGVSCRGLVGNVGVGGCGGSCRGGVGWGWVIQGWVGVVGHVQVGWGVSCRGVVGHAGV